MSDHIDPASADNPLRDILTLANTVRRWRGPLGWSQDDLSRVSGVSQKAISEIETGISLRPQERTLIALANAFAEAYDLAPASVLKDLKTARDTLPASPVSPFAVKLDNLLDGLSPPLRLFMEEMLMEYFHTILRTYRKADELSRAITKKRSQGR